MKTDEINIRPLYESDLIRLNEIRRSIGVYEYILSLKDETLSDTISYFTENKQFKHTYIAEKSYNGQAIVVGYIRLCIDEDARRRHKGKLSIAIASEYQCNGIGGRLLDIVIDLAFNWLMLKKIELVVLTKNTKAINLYKTKGFEIEGTLKFDTVVNGKYEDVYVMSKFSKENVL